MNEAEHDEKGLIIYADNKNLDKSAHLRSRSRVVQVQIRISELRRSFCYSKELTSVPGRKDSRCKTFYYDVQVGF